MAANPTYFTPPPRDTTLNTLNPQQESFCVEYVTAGCSGMGMAYVKAYGKEDDELAQGTINARAYQLMRKPAIQARIAELRKIAAADASYLLSDHLQRLQHLSVLAEAMGDIKLALVAELARGKAAGYGNDNIPKLPNPNGVQPGDLAQLPVNNIQSAVIVQSMSPVDATRAYENLLTGNGARPLDPTVIMTIPARQKAEQQTLVVE